MADTVCWRGSTHGWTMKGRMPWRPCSTTHDDDGHTHGHRRGEERKHALFEQRQAGGCRAREAQGADGVDTDAVETWRWTIGCGGGCRADIGQWRCGMRRRRSGGGERGSWAGRRGGASVGDNRVKRSYGGVVACVDAPRLHRGVSVSVECPRHTGRRVLSAHSLYGALRQLTGQLAIFRSWLLYLRQPYELWAHVSHRHTTAD